MPDYSVTSDTGLILMPEYQCQTDKVDHQEKCRCRTNFSPVFWDFMKIYL